MITTGRRIQRSVAALVAAVAMAFGGARAYAAEPADAALADSVNRAVAVVMADNLDEVLTGLTKAKLPVDRAEVGRYIAQRLAGGDLGISRQDANMLVDNMIRANSSYLPDSVSVESQQGFLAVVAQLPGAIVMPDGLIFTVITEGEGVHPAMDDKVKVRYVARLSDGTVFDDTENELVTFDVAKVIPGFTEGLMMMKPGGTYRVVIPAQLGYGEHGIPGIIPANAALDFTVTLDEVLPGGK